VKVTAGQSTPVFEGAQVRSVEKRQSQTVMVTCNMELVVEERAVLTGLSLVGNGSLMLSQQCGAQLHWVNHPAIHGQKTVTELTTVILALRQHYGQTELQQATDGTLTELRWVKQAHENSSPRDWGAFESRGPNDQEREPIGHASKALLSREKCKEPIG